MDKQPICSKIQEIYQKITWKVGIALLIPTFIIFPKPFLYILKPFINHIRQSYHQTKPEITKLIFSIDKHIQPQKLIKDNIINLPANNIFVINQFGNQFQEKMGLNTTHLDEELESSQKEMFMEMWAQNIIHQIRLINLQAKETKNSNIAILIKGNSELIRKIEAKLYKLRFSQYYKIPYFASNQQLHILSKNMISSFQHSVYSPRQK